MKPLLKRLLFGGVGGGTLWADLALALPRIYGGAMLAFGHGLSKVPVSDEFVSNVGSMGFPAPTASAWLAALGELVGGILLALGLLTRFAALWVVGVMAGAAFVTHGASFTGEAPLAEAEMALLYLVIALPFIVIGSGRTGIDRFLRKA